MTTKTNKPTKQITFSDAIKLCKKFTLKQSTRPVLQYIHFNGTHLIATDAHMLIRIDIQSISDFPYDTNAPFLYCPKQLTIIDSDSNYPDISRIIPYDANFTISINPANLKEFTDHVKESKKVVNKKRNNDIALSFNEQETTLQAISSDSTIKYNATINNLHTQYGSITLSLNPIYLSDALTSIKKLMKYNHTTPALNLISNTRPLHFKQDNVFDIILMPVRRLYN